jgi:hypothetical protein
MDATEQNGQPPEEKDSEILWRVLAWMERVRACPEFLAVIKRAAREAAKREAMR